MHETNGFVLIVSEPPLAARAIRFDAGPGHAPHPITTIGKLGIGSLCGLW
jgi:hypothetical protein